MVKIGQQITLDRSLEVFHSGKIYRVKLSEFKEKWLVLVFYPADFTFICPTELGEIADLYEEFQGEGAEVLSVSTDTPHVHKAWHEQSPTIRKVQFPMLSDPTGRLCKEFGTYIDSGEDEGRSLRGSFIIDPNGILKALEVHDNSIGRSARELLRKLRAAKFVSEHDGEVCPASWEPGKDTLKPSDDLVGKI